MATALSKQYLIAGGRGCCSDKNINSGPILSFDAVCMGSPVITMLQNSEQQV